MTGQPAPKVTDPFEVIPEMSRARANFTPVILYFFCGDRANPLAKACSRLNGTVCADTEVVKLSGKFLCLACDFTKLHKSLQIQFKIRTIPTLLFADSFGNVLYTLRGGTIAPRAFLKFMDNTLKRNDKAVKEYKERMEALQGEFQKADALLDEGKFDDAKVILERMAGNTLDADLAEGAKTRLMEMKIGLIFFEGVKALEARDLDLAKIKFDSVADSQIDNRWSSRAWQILKTLPAGKLYFGALDELEAGNTFEAMQKLQKVVEMEEAGHYTALAQEKLDEIKKKWNERVR